MTQPGSDSLLTIADPEWTQPSCTVIPQCHNAAINLLGAIIVFFAPPIWWDPQSEF
uniref:Uncharacterized protein n=1 Tax=Nelumbo nucifera TaxID=4432 RepID=A0A822YHL3_NELNU|nr:TPA_asm: hypothetical protein HUJ06_010848 [Nelumbo nucifera]